MLVIDRLPGGGKKSFGGKRPRIKKNNAIGREGESLKGAQNKGRKDPGSSRASAKKLLLLLPC